MKPQDIQKNQNYIESQQYLVQSDLDSTLAEYKLHQAETLIGYGIDIFIGIIALLSIAALTNFILGKRQREAHEKKTQEQLDKWQSIASAAVKDMEEKMEYALVAASQSTENIQEKEKKVVKMFESIEEIWSSLQLISQKTSEEKSIYTTDIDQSIIEQINAAKEQYVKNFKEYKETVNYIKPILVKQQKEYQKARSEALKANLEAIKNIKNLKHG